MWSVPLLGEQARAVRWRRPKRGAGDRSSCSRDAAVPAACAGAASDPQAAGAGGRAMNARQEAGAIFAHYFEQLARRVGVRGTERTAADIDRAAALLAQADDADAATIPPFALLAAPAPPQLETRVTQQFDADAQGWEDFRR